MSDFYVTLPSNTKVAGNKTSHYRCPLAHPIELEGQWQVGLASIQYPPIWENVMGGEWVEFNLRKPTLQMVRIHIPRGKYDSVEMLVEMINTHINKYWDKEEENAITEHDIAKVSVARECVKFVYASELNKVKVRIAAYYGNHLKFSDKMQSMLGFAPEIVTRTGGGLREIIATNPPNFDDSLASMYVYTDIIESQFVGDVLVPLLKIVPVQNSADGVVCVEYPNIHYVNVLHRKFDSVEMGIKTDTGVLFPFISGKLIVKLHFRKNKNLL
ncbi:MAG: hypothetical protein GY821_01905 [Gammaproteobacteria bacterium]|nr:hypothetical protein [Gammaproteobacteria bacterium]